MKLLNPGPVTLTDRVRRALLREDMCHRELDFAALMRRLIDGLAAVYGAAEHTPVVLTGSGTAAVEAMLGSLVPRDGHALVAANGVYGERAAAMLEAQGKRHRLVRGEWTAPLDLDAIARALRSGAFTHCVAVHHETTTGRLNDIDRLGRICADTGVPLLLDTVSSFGGEEIRWDEWNLAACAATANKCLHAVPGIALVVARTSLLERAGGASSSVYLDLHRYYCEQRSGFSPFTPAVQSIFALDEALAELRDEGGVKARHARYAARTAQVMSGLAALGIATFLDRDAYSSILTSYRTPASVGYDTLHDRLKDDGFVIYAGQGSYAGKIFRIAVMGDVSSADIERLLASVAEVAGVR